jgi:hypothetical protein
MGKETSGNGSLQSRNEEERLVCRVALAIVSTLVIKICEVAILLMTICKSDTGDLLLVEDIGTWHVWSNLKNGIKQSQGLLNEPLTFSPSKVKILEIGLNPLDL